MNEASSSPAANAPAYRSTSENVHLTIPASAAVRYEIASLCGREETSAFSCDVIAVERGRRQGLTKFGHCSLETMRRSMVLSSLYF